MFLDVAGPMNNILLSMKTGRTKYGTCQEAAVQEATAKLEQYQNKTNILGSVKQYEEI